MPLSITTLRGPPPGPSALFACLVLCPSRAIDLATSVVARPAVRAYSNPLSTSAAAPLTILSGAAPSRWDHLSWSALQCCPMRHFEGYGGPCTAAQTVFLPSLRRHRRSSVSSAPSTSPQHSVAALSAVRTSPNLRPLRRPPPSFLGRVPRLYVGLPLTARSRVRAPSSTLSTTAATARPRRACVCRPCRAIDGLNPGVPHHSRFPPYCAAPSTGDSYRGTPYCWALRVVQRAHPVWGIHLMRPVGCSALR